MLEALHVIVEPKLFVSRGCGAVLRIRNDLRVIRIVRLRSPVAGCFGYWPQVVILYRVASRLRAKIEGEAAFYGLGDSSSHTNGVPMPGRIWHYVAYRSLTLVQEHVK